jgi:hypothetical protein
LVRSLRDDVMAVQLPIADILEGLRGVDGPGSGLDADLLQGNLPSAFQTASAALTAYAALGLDSLDNRIARTDLEGLTLVDDLRPPFGVTPQTVGADVTQIQGGGSAADIWTPGSATSGELTLHPSGGIQANIASGAGAFFTANDRSIASNVVTVAFAVWLQSGGGTIFTHHHHANGYGFTVGVSTSNLQLLVYTGPSTIVTALNIAHGGVGRMIAAAISYDRANQIVRWASNFGARYGEVTGVTQAVDWAGQTNLLSGAFGILGGTSSVSMISYGAAHYTSAALASKQVLETLVREQQLRYAAKVRLQDLDLAALATFEGIAANPATADQDMGGNGIYGYDWPVREAAGTSIELQYDPAGNDDRGKIVRCIDTSGDPVTVTLPDDALTGQLRVHDATTGGVTIVWSENCKINNVQAAGSAKIIADRYAVVDITRIVSGFPVGEVRGDIEAPVDLGGNRLTNLVLADYGEARGVQTGVTGALSIDASVPVHHVTHGAGNITSTTISNWPAASGDYVTVTVHIKQDGVGGRTYAHPTGLTHVNAAGDGAAPSFITGAGKTNVMIYGSADGGTTKHAFFAGAY